jgi:type VI secretion system secreted protein Hcp
MKFHYACLMRFVLLPVILLAFPCGLTAALTGYIKIPDIDGESKDGGHEGEIDFHGISWVVELPDGAEGSGRTRARAQVGDIRVRKELDKSSPYLALACARGQVFDEIELVVRKGSGDAHLDYLTITMTNVVITKYSMDSSEADQVPTEEVAFYFEKINYKYIVQNEDHSAGEEHEIEYDVAAGV